MNLDLTTVFKSTFANVKSRCHNIKTEILNYLLVYRYCLIFAILITGVSFWLQTQSPPLKNEGILYLLSAISQGLAAIFALVFTITLMAASMARKYTAIDDFFDKETKILMVLFIISIILPLMLLQTNVNIQQNPNIFISISLGLAAFCVSATMPHLKKCNTKVKFEIGVPKLSSELNESLSKGSWTKASTIIYELSEIADKAIQENKEKTLRLIIIQANNFIDYILSKEEHPVSVYPAIHVLVNMGVGATHKGMDRVATDVTKTLGDKSVQMIDKKMINPSVITAIEGLEDIGIPATKNKLKHTSIESLKQLLIVAKAASINPLGEFYAEKSITQFGACAAHFEKCFPEQADEACNELKSLSKKHDGYNEILKKVELAKDDINRLYPDVAGYLEKFMKRYQQGS